MALTRFRTKIIQRAARAGRAQDRRARKRTHFESTRVVDARRAERARGGGLPTARLRRRGGRHGELRWWWFS